ncbi:hypothetical protein FH972_025535 [Carpinus fangiana]|uniref:Uncharacterized protein n=1 Tax=Carpinus fangiana TaxID=176857 RepID=A0A5N6L1W9_9ROSI|nr:hypothetical protein FH972_025535 [Carpinus fangiana]
MIFLWREFRRLYSQDTIDTRLTTSSKTPIQPATVGDASKGAQRNGTLQQRDVQSRAPPSKWMTPEYIFYIIVVSIAVPWMTYVPYTVSKASHPEYHKFEGLLSDGWIPGRKVDNSDAQYANFRNNVPYLAALVILHPLLRRAYESFFASPDASAKPDVQGDARLQKRVSFDVFFGIVFLLALNGTSAPKVLLLLYLNYRIAKDLPRPYIPAATWIFNMGVLLANELCHGYPYADIVQFVWGGTGPNWGSTLDRYGGLNSRWEVLFNITMLRLVSFNMDYYWSLNQQSGNAIEKKQLTPSTLSERDRISIPAAPAHYSFSHYLAYTLYAPLFLAGPILTFNDFISQARHPPASLTLHRTTLYALRFLFALLTMELLLHHIYVVAISKSSPSWAAYSPFELSMLGFFNLQAIWLKLLIPWRFFRLWALLDAIDPPENMLRCVSNNYSTLAFWRAWHRSFNRWIVRYLFVPLGGGAVGTARAVANMLVVFSFVALWHDISATLLVWGWGVVLFVLPEVLCAQILFPRRRFAGRTIAGYAGEDVHRWLSGVGAVGNILMMMAANLVGFVMGVDGVRGLLEGIVGSWGGALFMLVASFVLYTGAQVMFEIREAEHRRGVDLKC